MDWVKLMTLNDLTKARLLKSKLDAFGIPSYISNENFSGLYGGFLSVDLFVQREALKDAVVLIQEANDPVVQECPNCHSTQIRETRVTRSGERSSDPVENTPSEEVRTYIRMECEICGEVWTDS